MHVPRSYKEVVGTVDAGRDHPAAKRIGPPQQVGSALDPSQNFSRADDLNPYDAPFAVVSWLLERIREHVQELADYASPGNVFTIPSNAIVDAGGNATLIFNAIPAGAFWLIDRIMVIGTSAALVAVYDSVIGSAGFRDTGICNSGGFLALQETTPIVLTTGEAAIIRVTGATVGAQVWATLQVRQVNR